MKQLLIPSMLVAFSTLVTSLPVFSDLHNHQDAEKKVPICGHDDHDSREKREQASVRNYWRDSGAANPESWVRFKILGFNDFHGQLESQTLFGRPAGGAAVLASYLEEKTEQSEHGAFIVHAGDHVGASPPVSALLQDEPAITFMNTLANEYCKADDDDEYEKKGKHSNRQNRRHRSDGYDDPRCNIVGTLGNHEFDEGVGEMLRLIYGGNHQEGPFLDEDYDGAHFPYVSANVVYKDTDKPVLAPYVIRKIRGVPVAFIGAVLKETPSIVTPTGVAGVDFLDEAESINRYARELKRKAVITTVYWRRVLIVSSDRLTWMPWSNTSSHKHKISMLRLKAVSLNNKPGTTLMTV